MCEFLNSHESGRGKLSRFFLQSYIMRSLIVLLFTVFIFSACGQNRVQTTNATNATLDAPATAPARAKADSEKSETECKICDLDFKAYKGDLDKEEVNGLLLALNDEFLAWATYDQINKDLDNPRPFINIIKAEARHAENLKVLFEKYKIPVPDNKWIGETEKHVSVSGACKAGVDAEIANVELYDKLLKSTKREDILTVYKNLQRASNENHLPAFGRCSEGGGNGNGRGRGRGNQ